MLVHTERDPRWRKPVAVSLGPHLVGAAMPHPDCWDSLTAQAGVIKRLAFRPPQANAIQMAKFSEFVAGWVKRNLIPLAATSDTSVDTWLAGTNYPEWRRAALRNKWANVEKMEHLRRRHFLVKSFMKDENYPEYKHGRGINSRTDEFKCAVGPIFKLIEGALFKHSQFIKYVPVEDRPRVIKERLSRLGGSYTTTDYTSFESLFTKELMEACEFQLYSYMTMHLPEGAMFMDLLRNVLAGVNHCHWRWFDVWVEATRMSGEMCTSLGNGFTNLMLMLFLCQENGTDVDGFVEGDDGIFSVSGKPPTPAQFEDLGMVIKMESHKSLATASFCGIVFDEEDLCNLTDPLEVVAKFGWANHRYTRVKSNKIRMLLRCKALSLAHQYPGSPIIQALAWYGLRMTKGVKNYVAGWVRKSGPAGMSMWERDQLLEAISRQDTLVRKSIGAGSRMLVEQLWAVPIQQQLAVEAYFDGLEELTPLELPSLVARVPAAWTDYWARYAVEHANVLDDQLDEPRLPVGALSGNAVEWRVG